MKKLLTILLSVFICFSVFAVENQYASSMSLRSIAMTDTDEASFVNPAQAYFYDDTNSLRIGVSASDNWAKGFYSEPAFDFSAIFVARQISIGFSSDITSIPVEKEQYSVYKDFSLDVNIATGYKFFGAGLGVTLGSSRVRSELDIPKNRRFFELSKNTFFEQYRRVGGSEFASVKAGIQFDLREVSFGMVLNDLYTNEDNGIEDAVSHWGRGLDFGVFWQEEKFAERGRLKPLVFSAGAEVNSLFSNEGTYAIGAEATVQLASDYTLSIRTGFSAPFKDVSQGRQVITVGAKVRFVDAFLSIIFPYGIKDEFTFKAGASFRI